MKSGLKDWGYCDASRENRGDNDPFTAVGAGLDVGDSVGLHTHFRHHYHLGLGLGGVRIDLNLWQHAPTGYWDQNLTPSGASGHAAANVYQIFDKDYAKNYRSRCRSFFDGSTQYRLQS